MSGGITGRNVRRDRSNAAGGGARDHHRRSDLDSCYFKDKTNIGKNGYTCALATVKWEGNPAGMLTADGKVYQIAGGLTANNNEKLWPILGHTVTISGEVTQAPARIPTITASEAKSISPPK